MWLWCRQYGILQAIENEDTTPRMNLSEILDKQAITSAIGHQTTLKHCAAADLRYFNQLKRARHCKDVISTSFSKSLEILLQSDKLIF